MTEGFRSADAPPLPIDQSLPAAPPNRDRAGQPDDASTADAAKAQAGEIATTAKAAGADVVDTAKQQAGEVTREAGRQARQLLDQTRTELTDQAAAQQERVAGGLRSLADELHAMAGRSEQNGVGTDLVQQAADRAESVSRWLENRDPGSLLEEVRAFARRRPGAYLAIAAGAGVLAGRLGRGLAADSGDAGDDGRNHSGNGQAAGSRASDRPGIGSEVGAGNGFGTPAYDRATPTLPPAPVPPPFVGGPVTDFDPPATTVGAPSTVASTPVPGLGGQDIVGQRGDVQR